MIKKGRLYRWAQQNSNTNYHLFSGVNLRDQESSKSGEVFGVL